MTSQVSDIPRPEHPRPDFMRRHWRNLNGRWRFTFDPRNVGEQQRWHRVLHPAASDAEPDVMDPFGGEIVVPFPWESRLSTVNDPDYQGAAWYQRVIEVPAHWAAQDGAPDMDGPQGLPSAGDTASSSTAAGAAVTWRLRPFLCFGAVDWHARVWVNGRFAGEHAGGYSQFDLDLSRYVRPGRPATLTVRAWDVTDGDVPIGKQTSRWYTHSGGIWQTVWLEGRPAVHLARIHVTPDLAHGSATFKVALRAADTAGGDYRVAVRSTGDSFPAVEQTLHVPASEAPLTPGDNPIVAETTIDVRVPDARPWSPEDPHLYDCTVSLAPVRGAAEADEVTTYFGLRTVSRGRWEERPYEYVFLNGEPVYLRGALDQAFHPDGLHTYPSDEAIRADVQAARDLGLNMLRCHIKINEPRYYYWCDKLGVLCMYDLPSATVYTPTARANWEQTFRDALERDYSHPSIFAWILFNETWGLEEHQTPASWNWVADMFRLAKELDPSRLIEDNSACLYDHVVTDLNTWHFYVTDYDRARRHVEGVVKRTYEGSGFNYVGHRFSHEQGAAAYKQGAEPLLNSEYAGLSARQGDRDISYSFKFLTTDLRRHDKICGYVYTELTDIEWEHNGLLNYDRSAKEFGYQAALPGMTVADLNGADFVGLDCPPCQTLPPGATFEAPVFVSHWDRCPLEGAVLRWRLTWLDRFGDGSSLDEGRWLVQPRRYGVTDAGSLRTPLPQEPGLATIAVWLEDGAGRTRARNYVQVDVSTGRPLPRVERTDRGVALRFSPGDHVDSTWPDPRPGKEGSKLGAPGAGWLEYVLELPADVARQAPKGLRLRFEAGARTARSRIDWKDPLHVLASDYPQTEARKLPTDLTVSINDVPLGSVRLPDDPADARGVLSAHLSESFEPCSYGFLTTLEADAARTRQILDAARGGQLVLRFEVPRSGRRGGLNLYGSRMGAFPIDPTLFVDF